MRWQCVGANGKVGDGGTVELEEEVGLSGGQMATSNVLEDLWAVL